MGHAAQMSTWYTYKISIGKSDVQRSRHRWDNKVRTDLKEIRCRPDSDGSGQGLEAGSRITL